jgi:hypothetical protein
MDEIQAYALWDETPVLAKNKRAFLLGTSNFKEVLAYLEKRQRNSGIWLISLWANGEKIQTLTKVSPLPKKPGTVPQYYTSIPKGVNGV